ncbi:hypothetical protein [Nocardia terpenica]|uniref:Uncharacterized protein n=1 Tax=Nocardia terpenica TaxID=455432 RepID=A0A164PWE2_9NOCA|nr:hypothetical protein [Nocardia terpenica]KZM76163.1 hypothetical protein AWN90_00075 [Nocardia terpenica]NQE90351.1 hypothetical protein [Nocardia terpenica]
MNGGAVRVGAVMLSVSGDSEAVAGVLDWLRASVAGYDMALTAETVHVADGQAHAGVEIMLPDYPPSCSEDGLHEFAWNREEAVDMCVLCGRTAREVRS